MSGGKPLPRVLSGTFRLTRFRADGLLLFDATPQAFFNSLAPLMAFPLVGGGLALLNGTLRTGIVNLLASVIALLAPPVLSHALARRWGREEFWLRYAVASNWCQSAMTLAALLIGFATAAASWGQPNGREAVLSAIVFVLFYWLILGWFLASRGLQLSAGRAVLFVVMLSFGTAFLVNLPLLAAEALQ